GRGRRIRRQSAAEIFRNRLGFVLALGRRIERVVTETVTELHAGPRRADVDDTELPVPVLVFRIVAESVVGRAVFKAGAQFGADIVAIVKRLAPGAVGDATHGVQRAEMIVLTQTSGVNGIDSNLRGHQRVGYFLHQCGEVGSAAWILPDHVDGGRYARNSASVV